MYHYYLVSHDGAILKDSKHESLTEFCKLWELHVVSWFPVRNNKTIAGFAVVNTGNKNNTLGVYWTRE